MNYWIMPEAFNSNSKHTRCCITLYNKIIFLKNIFSTIKTMIVISHSTGKLNKYVKWRGNYNWEFNVKMVYFWLYEIYFVLKTNQRCISRQTQQSKKRVKKENRQELHFYTHFESIQTKRRKT